jgi:hypothetical protein
MPRSSQPELPAGITVKTRRHGGATVPAMAADGTVLYRVRMWDPVLKKQIERVTAGRDAAEQILADFNAAKRQPGRTQAEVGGGPALAPSRAAAGIDAVDRTEQAGADLETMRVMVAGP